MQVLDHVIEVEAAEFMGVVECLPQRIGQRGLLVELVKIQLVRPPVAIDPGQDSLMATFPARYRALAFS
jgi:hypothetical protein